MFYTPYKSSKKMTTLIDRVLGVGSRIGSCKLRDVFYYAPDITHADFRKKSLWPCRPATPRTLSIKVVIVVLY